MVDPTRTCAEIERCESCRNERPAHRHIDGHRVHHLLAHYDRKTFQDKAAIAVWTCHAIVQQKGSIRDFNRLGFGSRAIKNLPFSILSDCAVDDLVTLSIKYERYIPVSKEVLSDV